MSLSSKIRSTNRGVAVGLCLIIGWSQSGHGQPEPPSQSPPATTVQKHGKPATKPAASASVKKPAKNATPKPVEKTLTISQQYKELQRLKRKFEDPAFDRYVNLVEVGKAWNRLDSVLLTDVAMQLAYGEDVLQRPHRKMTADMVLDLALKLALENDDQASLDRLTKCAEQYRKTELAERIAATRNVSQASRATGIPLTALRNVPPKAYRLYQVAIADLTRCRITQDAPLLKRMEASRAIKSLPEPLKADIERQFAELHDLMPTEGTEVGKPEVLDSVIQASQLRVPPPPPLID